MLKDEIMDIAIPGEYFLEFPANVKVIGITKALPKPTSENPNIAGQKLGNNIAIKIPEKINNALNM